MRDFHPWLAIGAEDPVGTERCPEDGHAGAPSPVDVYCPEHGTVLLLQDVAGRRRWWAFNLVRLAVVGLVVLAAGRHSIWPVYLLAVLTGAAAIGVPLHAHRLARVVGVAGWLLVAAVAAAVAASDLHAEPMRIVWTAAVGLLLAMGVALGVLSSIALVGDALTSAEREARRAVAGSALVAVTAFAGWWLTSGNLSGRFVELPDAASRWLLFFSLGSALTGLMAAATGAFVVSLDEMDTGVGRWTATRLTARDRPSPFEPLPRPRGQVARWRWRLVMFARRLKRSLRSLRNQVVKGTIAALNLLLVIANELANWVRRRLTLLGRRVVFVLRGVDEIVRAGLTVGLTALDHVWRPVLASAGAIAGAIVAVHLAEAFTRYLVDGPLDGLAAGAGWSALGLAACFLAADGLSSVDHRAMARAVGGIVGNATPDVVLFTVLAGWVVGIPGTLGYGPIHVGWVTGLGTIGLAVVMAPEWLRERRLHQQQPMAGTL